ncbi:hypothetical protein ACHAWF_013606 [Thalassiosira exigua]
MKKILLHALPFAFVAPRQVATFTCISLSPARAQKLASAAPSHFSVQAPNNVAPFGSIIRSKKWHSAGSILLSASSDEADVQRDDKKIQGRKKRVVMGYKAIIISYLAVVLTSASKAGISPILLKTVAGYILPPVGISYIMISAAEHDRLSSDTYKRLNLALLEYGLVGLSVIAISGKQPFLSLPFGLSVINSIKGYTYGVLGWSKQNSETTLLRDLLVGTKETLTGFFSLPKNIKASGYMVATAMVGCLKLLKLKEIIQYVLANSFAEGAAPLLARFKRLALFTLILYTLKDAADRDRLGGTTFIQLNYLAALLMAVNHFFCEELPVVASAIFATFFAFNGVSAYFKKSSSAKS